MIKLFISYSNIDSHFADRIANELKELNTNIFYDKWSIKVGESIVEKINEALSSHDILLVLLSKNSVKSEWVKKEINSTLMKQLSTKQIRILPILIEPCSIPYLLSDIKYADFTGEYKNGINQIYESLADDINLIEFENMVSDACPHVTDSSHLKQLAIQLKRQIHMTFFRSSILSCVYEHNEISKENILDQYDNRDDIFLELEHLVDDGNIDKIIKNGFEYYKINNHGSLIYECLKHAYNTGLYAPTCSH